MSDFVFYFRLGFWHVFDFNALDHILFLIVLVLPFGLRDWKKIIAMLSAFTFGHTLSLSLALYDFISANEKWVEFLIIVSIFLTALANIFFYHKKKSKGYYVFSGLFGWVHGMGFSMYLRMLLEGAAEKFYPLMAFALGIEIVQILVVAFILSSFFILDKIFRISKRDWIFFNSAMVIGIILPILIERLPF